MKQLNLIAAVADNYVIGANGAIPWHIPEDFKLFRRETLGSAVIMGENTYKSLGKPLPQRLNIVLSDVLRPAESLVVAHSLDEAIKFAHDEREKAFIIGGASVYAQTINMIDFAYISHVKGEFSGDTYFPRVDYSKWKIVEEQDYEKFIFRKYQVNPLAKIN